MGIAVEIDIISGSLDQSAFNPNKYTYIDKVPRIYLKDVVICLSGCEITFYEVVLEGRAISGLDEREKGFADGAGGLSSSSPAYYIKGDYSQSTVRFRGREIRSGTPGGQTHAGVIKLSKENYNILLDAIKFGKEDILKEWR